MANPKNTERLIVVFVPTHSRAVSRMKAGLLIFSRIGQRDISVGQLSVFLLIIILQIERADLDK